MRAVLWSSALALSLAANAAFGEAADANTTSAATKGLKLELKVPKSVPVKDKLTFELTFTNQSKTAFSLNVLSAGFTFKNLRTRKLYGGSSNSRIGTVSEEFPYSKQQEAKLHSEPGVTGCSVQTNMKTRKKKIIAHRAISLPAGESKTVEYSLDSYYQHTRGGGDAIQAAMPSLPRGKYGIIFRFRCIKAGGKAQAALSWWEGSLELKTTTIIVP